MQPLALKFLLRGNEGQYGRNNIPTPHECSDCPFAKPDPEEEPPNWSDPGEGYYLCELLGKEEVARRQEGDKPLKVGTVWGENPQCTEEDWRKRLLVEAEPLLKESIPA